MPKPASLQKMSLYDQSDSLYQKGALVELNCFKLWWFKVW